jgi:quercetin dioxygenase-like cupin family protein
MMPGTVMTESDVEALKVPGDTAVERRMIPSGHYAEPMVHRSLRFALGESQPRRDHLNDELLYVMAGDATIAIRDDGQEESYAVREGDAVQIHAGESWNAVVSEGELHLLSFLVPAPVTPWSAQLARLVDRVIHVARLGEQHSEAATADRQFEVLFDRNRGSRGATMFVGFIPTSGAPEHYHLYDEICVIIRGSGTLHALGRTQPIESGSAFHVAPRLLHAIENPNPADIWILGVFRPEGSAAAAFYPDGRPAPTNED